MKRTVKYGSVVVQVEEPSAAEVRRNIKAGQRALARAVKVLATPGVKLKIGERVPLYRADPDRPGGIIRKLRGQEERGVIRNGKFKPT